LSRTSDNRPADLFLFGEWRSSPGLSGEEDTCRLSVFSGFLDVGSRAARAIISKKGSRDDRMTVKKKEI
jgi:hypothetical protein